MDGKLESELYFLGSAELLGSSLRILEVVSVKAGRLAKDCSDSEAWGDREARDVGPGGTGRPGMGGLGTGRPGMGILGVQGGLAPVPQPCGISAWAQTLLPRQQACAPPRHPAFSASPLSGACRALETFPRAPKASNPSRTLQLLGAAPPSLLNAASSSRALALTHLGIIHRSLLPRQLSNL